MGIIKNNTKLWESLGLTFLLLAWGLEWNAYRKYESANRQFVDGFQERQDLYFGQHQVLVTEMEGAKTRAAATARLESPRELSETESDSIYWGSAEVRHVWLNRIINHISGFEHQVRHLENMESQYNLGFDSEIKGLRSDLEKFKWPLARLGPLKENEQYSLPNTFTSQQAGAANREFAPIPAKTIRIFDSMHVELIKLRERGLDLYRGLYIGGSFLLIIPGIWDWCQSKFDLQAKLRKKAKAVLTALKSPK